MKRVMCLYRVSTKGQVDPQDDIPMQRRECLDSPAWEMVDRAHDCWANENAAKTVFTYAPNRCIIISGGDDA